MKWKGPIRTRLSLVLILMLVLAACGGADTTDTTDGGEATTTTAAGGETTTTASDGGQTTAPPAEGDGELVVGLGAMTEELNPFQATSPPRNFLTNLVYSHLLNIDATDGPPTPQPEVLQDWTQIDDLTWEFTVVPGLTFPNGEALDATAAAFAVNWARNKENVSNMAGSLSMINGAEAVDAETLRVTLDFPTGIIPLLVGMIPVVPPELFQEIGPDAYYLNPESASGQYRVVEHVPGERLVLEANPDSIEPQPASASLTIVEIPEDAGRVAALAAGDVDVINKVPTDQISSVESAGSTIFAAIDPGAYVIDLYRIDGQLNDPLARQAMNLAIDRQALVDGLLGGLGQAASHIGSPTDAGYCATLPPYEYDLAEANRLMAEAGLSNLDLTFVSSQGFLLNDALLAQAIAQQLEQLDAINSVTLEIMEFSSYLDVYYFKTPTPDLFAWRASSAPTLDIGPQFARFTTQYPTHNLSWVSEEYDVLYEQMAAAPFGSEERQELACGLAEFLRNDPPQIFALNLPDIWAHSPAVDGFIVDGAGQALFANMSAND